jgi:hypothetical protein
MMEQSERETQAALLGLLDQIDKLLGDVRTVVIDGDPEMNEALRKKVDGVD